MGRILIAEDDPDASEMLARICVFRGHEVSEARDALQAVRLFTSFRPDVVITDLAMPLGGGHHLMHAMRATKAGRGCPVIVITGYAGALGVEELAALQPCTILPKPPELDPMLKVLDAAFEAAAANAPPWSEADYAPCDSASSPDGQLSDVPSKGA